MRERQEAYSYYHVIDKYLEWLTTPETAERLLAGKEQALLLYHKNHSDQQKSTLHTLALLERNAEGDNPYGLRWDFSHIEPVPQCLLAKDYDLFLEKAKTIFKKKVIQLMGSTDVSVQEEPVSTEDVDVHYSPDHSILRSHLSRPLDTADFIGARHLFPSLTNNVAYAFQNSSPVSDSRLENAFTIPDDTILKDVHQGYQPLRQIVPYPVAPLPHIL